MAPRLRGPAKRMAGLVMAALLVYLLGAPAAAADRRGTDAEAKKDPDRPAFLGALEPATYLRLRGEHEALLHGVGTGAPDARQRAVHDRDEQQARHAVEAQGSPFEPAPTATSPQGGAQSPTTSGASAAQPTWAPVGPAPIPNGQVEGNGGAPVPVSGRISAIAVHPTKPDIVYVGAAQGGVYRTVDGGSTWAPIFDGAQSLAIGAIAVAPSAPDTVYVGTGEANLSVDSYAGVGIYRIDNAGTTAELVGPINPLGVTAVGDGTPFTGRAISRIVVSPTDPATIFVGTTSGVMGLGGEPAKGGTVPPLSPRGLFRSRNATAASESITFEKLTVTTAASVAPDTTGNRSIVDIALDPGDPSHLVAAAYGTGAANDGGLYLSTNALDPTSTVSFVQKLSLNQGRAAFAANRVAGTTTFLAATEESGGSLRRSSDGGASWSSPFTSATGFCGTQCWYDMPVALDPADARRIYLGGASAPALERSSDGGATFAASQAGLHADTHAIAVASAPNDNVVYTGNDGGVFKSTDSGATWTSLNTSALSASQFQSVASHPFDASSRSAARRTMAPS